MKKLLIGILLVLVLAVSVSAADGSFTGGWATCNTQGGYGGWDKTSTCLVAWDGITQPCTDENRDATFIAGETGMTTTSISITHLDGATDDGFDVMDGSSVVCSYTDTGTEEVWKTLVCPVNFNGEKTFTLHPTAATPWADCGTWGQLAISGVTFVADNQVPEFGVIAACVAVVGAVGGMIVFRKQ